MTTYENDNLISSTLISVKYKEYTRGREKKEIGAWFSKQTNLFLLRNERGKITKKKKIRENTEVTFALGLGDVPMSYRR